MNRMHISAVFLRIFLCLIVAVVLISCLSSMDINRGKTVPQSNRILLKPGELQRGVWMSPNVDFHYTCRREIQKLELSGDVYLKKATLQGGARKVNQFVLTAYMLDDTGNILAYDVVMSWNLPAKMYQWSVKKTLDLPQNCSAIAFGYSGEVSDGKKEATILDLYYSPTGESSHSLQ